MGEQSKSDEKHSLELSDWVQLLRNEIAAQTSVLLGATGIIAAFVIGLMAGSVESGRGSLVYGGCFLALIWIYILYKEYGKITTPRQRLIDRIIEETQPDLAKIREEYLSIRQTDKRPPPEFKKLAIYLSAIIVAILIFLTVVILVSNDNDEDGSSEMSSARYKITYNGQSYYTQNYEIRDKSVLIKGWYTETEYNPGTIIFMDGMVIIEPIGLPNNGMNADPKSVAP